MSGTTAISTTRHDAAEASSHKLLDTSEAAKFLKMGKRTVQELVAARKLAFIKIGRAIRFDPADLRTFVNANRVQAVGWKKSRGATR
jgi:excisionase family DNA binding protein